MDRNAVLKALSPRALAFLKQVYQSSMHFESRTVMPAINIKWSYQEADKIVTELEVLRLVRRGKALGDVVGDITDKGVEWMKAFEKDESQQINS